MKEWTLDDLVLLPEEEAAQRSFDSHNYRWLKRFALLFAAGAVVVGLVFLFQRRYFQTFVPLANLLLIRFLFTAGEKQLFSSYFRLMTLVYLLVQALFIGFYDLGSGTGFLVAAFLFPALLPFFRLKRGEFVLLYLTIWGGTAGVHLLERLTADAPLISGRLIGQTVLAAGALLVAVSITQRQRRLFLATWRREASRSRERARMRRELDSARQIQLSMLPRKDPKFDWLEVAGVCLPATEVGGDYYEYFELASSRVAIVVGDVAGHGVASGLLLSGVRSCLHLLHEESPAPVQIMDKLNRMVRQTTDRRMFITLLYGLLDRGSRTLELSTAGHPPLLHFHHATGAVEEISLSAPPLGTRLTDHYSETTVPFAPQDVFVFYTDGLPETVNHRGEEFGDDRLISRIRETASSKSARELRETVLNDLWNFKGDAEQRDDITMVVVKVLEDESVDLPSP